MKYLTNSGLSYFLNKIKAYLTSNTYLNSIGISNSEIDNIADDAGYSSGSLPASEDVFLTGDIIPNTDNSVDLGASSKNIKMVYTKGITINGTQFLPSDYIPKTGSNQISGDLVPSTDGTVNLGSSVKEYNNAYIKSLTINGVACGDILTHNVSEFFPKSGGELNGTIIKRNTNNDHIEITGGTDYNSGPSLVLTPYNSTEGWLPQGSFVLHTNNHDLIGYPNGTLTWNNKNVAMAEDTVPRSGGAVMTGDLKPTRDNSAFGIGGGTDQTSGSIVIYGKDFSAYGLNGTVRFLPTNRNIYNDMQLRPDGSWTWGGTAVQLISDQRYKQQITEIDDKLLDAWEDVELSQFKYNDAVNQKGDNARLHTGYVVQQIDTACKSHGVDISAYGLYCHEEYPEETEEVEVEQEDGTIKKETKVIREASEHYSLRYTEVYAIECAYLRKRIKELEERLEKLEGNAK